MKKLIEKINLVLFGVMVPAVILRLFNLGYSDYQGDEIKALFLPGDGQNFFSYLLDQRKGPVQFLITFLLKFINPDYTNQLLIRLPFALAGILSRLPFALAGILSVFFLYKLVEMHFGKRTALLSALLLGSNGFFVAFSRIVQYQSFTILFMILALYMLTLSVKRSEYKHKGIIWAYVFWALGILSHYDAVFILPFVMYLMSVWLKRNFKKDPRALKTLIISLTVSAALLLAFYIPFVLSISESTLSYWSGRISGDVSAKISSSKYLFSVYQPIYVVHFYVLASLLGLAFLYYKAYGVLTVSAALLLAFYIPFVLSISESTLSYWSGRISGDVSAKISSSKYLFSVYQPIYVVHFYILASLLGLAFLYYKAYGIKLPKKIAFKSAASYISLFAWFFIPFAFMEWLVYIPGTHIYAYILPVIIIMAIGLDGMVDFLTERLPGTVFAWAYQVILFLIFTFIFAQSYAVFVDNNKEYPWEEEKFLVWTFPEPTPIYHLSLFGFPYYRDWEGISAFIKQYPEITAYSTNERKSIVRYFVPLEKDTNKAGFYIHIRNPQTFNWMEKYDPIFTLTKSNQDYVRMYIMETGTLKEINEKGY